MRAGENPGEIDVFSELSVGSLMLQKCQWDGIPIFGFYWIFINPVTYLFASALFNDIGN